ncbi:MAG: right-handed parallel beta-helix repeat-containing protein [Armatimonadetes bacterium]|nr:right-handed parallel beta-helix repeat-containing protein [Armatimonadota bacterium]
MRTTPMGAILAVALWTAVCRAAVLPVPPGDVAALTAALTAAQPGDTVQLAAGTYTLTETLKPPTGIKLLGAGMDQTVLHYGGEKPAVMVALTGVNEVEIAQMTLDAQESELVQRPLSAYNCSRLNLHHLAIRNTAPKNGSPAIHFNGQAKTYQQGVLDSIICDCVIENLGVDSGWGCGVRISWGSSRNQVLRCKIDRTGRGGILTDNRSNDLIARGNTITGSGGTGLGIEIWGGCDRCVVEDNVIDHWLSIGGSDYAAVRRNVVSDKSGITKGYGIEAIGSYGVYTGNLVDDGTQIGLSVSGPMPKDLNYYGDNIFRNCWQWGTQLQGEKGGINYTYLCRCQFSDTILGRGKVSYPGYEGHGFRINGNVQHLVLDQCRMADNGRYGVQLGPPNVDFLSFLGCIITGNKSVAVADLRDYTALEFKDCVVKDNGSDKLPPEKPFPTPPPQAIIVGPAQARAGQTVEFTCRSGALDAPAAQVLWDLGAGAPQTGRRAHLAYAEPGRYLITMVLWAAHGRGVRCEKTVTIGPTGP